MLAKGLQNSCKRARPVSAPKGERWGSPHAVQTCLLGVEGAHFFDALLQDFFIDKHTFAVFSIPETYNVAARKISGAQYAKNMSVLAGSIAAGAGGAIAAGVVAAKVAGAAGTAVAPGVGTVVGIAGGFVGGAVGAKVVKTTGDILYEDDVETLGRLFNAYVSCLIGEYLLDEAEIDCLISRLNEIRACFKTRKLCAKCQYGKLII